MIQMGKPFQDLTSQTFGDWTVLPHHKSVPRPSGKGSPRTLWFCTCVCGKTAWVYATNLRQGISKNCGCKKREIARHNIKAARESVTGGKPAVKHGMSQSRLYRRWAAMLDRCYNPASVVFKHYGGRGITVYEPWHKFEPFRDWALANGYNDGLSLDRINNDGNYEPSNCRFITQKEQNRNKRNTVMLTPILSLSSFCESNHIAYDLVWHTCVLHKNHPNIFSELLNILHSTT